MSDRLQRWREAVCTWHDHICTCNNPVKCLQGPWSTTTGEGHGGQGGDGTDPGDAALLDVLRGLEGENATGEGNLSANTG